MKITSLLAPCVFTSEGAEKLLVLVVQLSKIYIFAVLSPCKHSNKDRFNWESHHCLLPAGMTSFHLEKKYACALS